MHRGRIVFGVAATIAFVGMASASTTMAESSPSPTASPARINSPTITLSVSSGTPGSQLSVIGSGFPANQPVLITFDTSCCWGMPGISDSQGTFVIGATIRPSAVGPHTICADVGYSQPAPVQAKACAPILVDPFKPTIYLSVDSGPPMTPVTITGRGFPPGSIVAIYIDTPQFYLGTPGPNADPAGNISMITSIQGPLTSGPHQVCGDALYMVPSGPPESANAKACTQFTVVGGQSAAASPSASPTAIPTSPESSPTPSQSPVPLAAVNTSSTTLTSVTAPLLLGLAIVIVVLGAVGTAFWIRRRRADRQI